MSQIMGDFGEVKCFCSFYCVYFQWILS